MRKKCLKFHNFFILLFGDISVNSGPTQYLQGNDNKFEPFDKRGSHFLHNNVNSLLLKTDEHRGIVGHTKAAILGITESKVGSSVSNQEFHIMVIVFLEVIEIKMVEVTYSFKFIIKRFSLSTYPKSEAYSIGIFYRPPNVNTFLETFFNDWKHIDLHKNEVYYFLGDFNVNHLLNYKFILKENQSLDFRNLNSPLVSKYKERTMPNNLVKGDQSFKNLLA